MKLKFSVLLLILAISMPNLLAKKGDIKLKLKKGDVYTTTMDMNNKIDQQMMGQQMKIDQEMLIISSMTVTDELKNGSFHIEQRYVRMKIDMNAMGQNISMDTEGESTPQNAALIKMKEAVIQYDVTPKGVISNITGFEELLQATLSDPQSAQMMKSFASDDMLKSFFSYIPQERVKVGDSYTSSTKLQSAMGAEIDIKYDVKEITKKQMYLDLSSDITFSPDTPIEQNGMKIKMSGTGTQGGNFMVNTKDGMPTSSEITQDMKMNLSFKMPQSDEDMSMPMKLKSIVKTTVTKN